MSALDDVVGQPEREAAETQLRGHLQTGRLTQAQFDDRLRTVRTATTTRQMEQAFADLPGGLTSWPTLPRPGEERFPHQGLAPVDDTPSAAPAPVAPVRPQPGPHRMLNFLQGVLWPVCLVVGIFTSFPFHYAILVGIVGSIVLSVAKKAFFDDDSTS